jgi:MFS family permease
VSSIASYKPVLSVALTAFIDFVGIGIIIPIAPFYAEHFGATPFEVTLLFTSYSLPQFLLAPIWGRISDRRGRRAFLLLGLSGEVFAYLIFAFSNSLYLLYFSRALAGSLSANFAIISSYVSDVTSEEQRVRGLGLIGAAVGLGFVFGPLLGGLLSVFGFRTPILFAALLCVVNLILVALYVKEPKRTILPKKRFSEIFSHAKQLYTMGFLVNLAFVALQVTIALYGQALYGWNSRSVGFILALIGVETAAIQGGAVYKLTSKIGEVRTIFLGLAVFASSYFILSFKNPEYLAILSIVLLGLGLGLTQPPAYSLISKLTPRGDQGAAFGLAQSLTSLSNIIGPVIAGVSFEYVSPFTPYQIGLALILAGLVIFALFTPA